jgi:agmatinase
LLPVEYDGIGTGEKVADKGPGAFLNASKKLELYDLETDSEVYKKGIHLCKPLTLFSSPKGMVNKIYNHVFKYLILNKFVTIIGGDHSISIGAIRAFVEKYKDLTVLHFDAHSDLRPTYNGSQYNRACAMHEASKTTNLIQVGIRSLSISEIEFIDKENVYFSTDILNDYYWMGNALNQITDKVYISIDLNVFDPSIMPSTCNTEPGGLLWEQTLEFLKKVFETKNVVGYDIVELCPNEYNKAPDYLAAKLYYKMLSYKFFHKSDKHQPNLNNIENSTNQDSVKMQVFSKWREIEFVKEEDFDSAEIIYDHV